MEMITLLEWFDLNSIKGNRDLKKLQRWVREGKINPTPEKEGRQYWVEPTAKLIKPRKTRSASHLVEKIKAEAIKLSELDRATVLSILISNID